jgi:serine/threonine protein kinase
MTSRGWYNPTWYQQQGMHPGMAEALIKAHMKQAAQSVVYIHQRNCRHMDINRVNIVLTSSDVMHVVDNDGVVAGKPSPSLLHSSCLEKRYLMFWYLGNGREEMAKDVRGLATTLVSMMTGEDNLTEYEDISFTTRSLELKSQQLAQTFANAGVGPAPKLIEFLIKYVYVSPERCVGAEVIVSAMQRHDFRLFAA